MPAPEELRAALAPLCAEAGISTHPLCSVRREVNDYARSHASEIVACRFADGGERRLFLKYMAVLDEGHRDHGMRGGLAYEALVYSTLLRGTIRPAFIGLHTADDGALWLVLECLDDAFSIDQSEDEAALAGAAKWLGDFHSSMERRLATARPAGVRVYDAEFLRGWARRTNEFAGDWHRRAPWLAGLCANFDRAIDTLLAPPHTLVHGEFYPHNVLFRAGEILPVDWESAAIGAGEMDLAALTEGWGGKMEAQCLHAYRLARWPGGAPDSFARRFAAARVFMHLRWMGEHPAWTEHEDAPSLLGELKRAAKRFGLAM